MRHRRLNIRYLRQVVDKLETLGVMLDDLPEEILEARWGEQRKYFEDVLELHYCVRCKLPISDADASTYGQSLCKQHYEEIARRFDTRDRVRRSEHPATRGQFVGDNLAATVPDAIQRMYQKKLHAARHLDASNHEMPTTDLAMDIDTILAKVASPKVPPGGSS
jgi:hypothetical protein